MNLVETKNRKKNIEKYCEQLIDLLSDYELENSENGRMEMGDTVIETRMVLITPELAEEMLKRNINNRPLNKIHVSTLKSEMLNGNWKFDAQPFRFNSLGELNDGQHRLQSVIETKTPIIGLVITGLDEDTFKSMDTGRKRNGGDVMYIEGVSNYSMATSTTRLIYAFNNGLYSANRNFNRNLKNTEIFEYYNSLPRIAESIKFGDSLAKKGARIITPTHLAGFHYLFAKKNRMMAEEFLEKLYTGIGLEVGSPINTLRTKFLKAKIDSSFKFTEQDKISNLIYAWNKFRLGETVKVLKVPEDFDCVIR